MDGLFVGTALMGFELTVAWRFLREGRFQSILIVFGFAAGVAVVTYISALISGLQANTIVRTLGTQAHVIVKPLEDRATIPQASTALIARDVQARAQRGRSIENWRVLIMEFAQLPGVIAVSPMVSGAALAVRGEASRAISLIGIELDAYERIVGLREKIVQGEARLAPGEVLVGLQLASDLGITVGDRLTVQTATGGSDSFKVAGLFDLGSRDANRRFVYVSLRSAQSLLDLPGGVTNIDLKVAEIFKADETAKLLARRTGLDVESWMQTNSQLLNALNAQSISTGLIRGFTVIVVMLGIASVLVVSVVQKRKEIGILRAMGATRTQMTRVFLAQGAFVGGLGSLIGVALAKLLLWVFMMFARGPDGAPLFVVELPLDLALSVAVIATLCGVLAAVAPARRAAKLDPAEAIRL